MVRCSISIEQKMQPGKQYAARSASRCQHAWSAMPVPRSFSARRHAGEFARHTGPDRHEGVFFAAP
jgi:hypothetical protein